ncbi:MAG: phenylalanine--tRNA ligase subunit beta [Epulopiscium sp. Nele67-Bin004]|nr:MAG: phenylalanine--tRNA ligase subunit beta [Epulopiscium sp. Nele67-Bin004]
MNVPMSWLNQYVDIDVDLKTFIAKMTLSGSKVETVEESGKEITKVVVGKIVEVEKHPDADRLRIMKADVGADEQLQIVTAATNVMLGDVVPVALDGATLANDLKIKSGKLRGVASQGMFCSVEELGLTREQFPDAPEDGIYIFNTEMTLGECVKPYFGLGEQVVEYEITSNRPDCFSIIGIAREVAATLGTQFKYPQIEVDQTDENATNLVDISIHNEELCPRYAARVVKNVKVKPSPKWLQDRLLSAGLRPINNIVDITNYILMEFGQPMHAFDYDKLEGKQINVRTAKTGETMLTLLGDEVELDDTMLVVADQNSPVAIAGIMGGENSKVTDETTTIVFECANFNGYNVRQTSKKLGIMSDSSKKFVKGLDPNTITDALERAVQLINMTDSGDVLTGVIDVYPNKLEPKTIPYDYKWINAFLGLDLQKAEMEKIFETLEFVVDTNNNTVTIPTFRPDITMNADLAEEVARMYGYDKIPVTLERATPTVGGKTKQQLLVDKIKTTLQMCGAYGALTYTIDSPKVFDKLNINEDSKLRDAIKIANPLGEEFSIMRTTTLNGMLTSLSTNYNRRNSDAALYEIGKVFIKKENKDLPNEIEKVTIGMYGKDVDFFSMKGVIETVVEALKISKVEYTRNTELEFMHTGRCANLVISGKNAGFFGEVHPQVTKNYEVDARLYVAELDLAVLLKSAGADTVYAPLPKYPASSRDLAMIVKKEVLVGDIEKVIKQRGGKLLKEVALFDVYEGNQVSSGQKSVAYKLTFRADDKTLTDEEVGKAIKKILNGLETTLDAKLRD